MYEIMLCAICFIAGLIFGHLRGSHVAYRESRKILEGVTLQVSDLQKLVRKSF